MVVPPPSILLALSILLASAAAVAAAKDAADGVRSIEVDAELLEKGEGVEGDKENYYRHNYHNHYDNDNGYDYGYGESSAHPGVVRTRVTVQKRILRPVAKTHYHHKPVVVVEEGPVVAAAGVDPLGGFEGSYVAVSGRPGQRTVHAVNGVNSVAIQPLGGGGPPIFVSRNGGGGVLPSVDYEDPFLLNGPLGGLPKCSYLDTDFEGDDVGDGRGLTTGSAYACKQACIDEGQCQFWTFRVGWQRDCYLKKGEGRGDVNPENVSPKSGFVSGTVGGKCVCLSSSEKGNDDQICPVRRTGGRGYGWRKKSGGSGGPRFDYDDNDNNDNDNDNDNDGDREAVTVRSGDADGGSTSGTEETTQGSTRRRNNNNNNNDNSSGSGRRNRNKNQNQNSTDGTNKAAENLKK